MLVLRGPICSPAVKLWNAWCFRMFIYRLVGVLVDSLESLEQGDNKNVKLNLYFWSVKVWGRMMPVASGSSVFFLEGNSRAAGMEVNLWQTATCSALMSKTPPMCARAPARLPLIRQVKAKSCKIPWRSLTSFVSVLIIAINAITPER